MQPPRFQRYLLTLRLTAPARFHFLHGGVLRGLLSAALGRHELPVGVVPFAPESGRARFDTGEPYRLGLTLVGEEIAGAESILTGLERVGREARRGRRAPRPRSAATSAWRPRRRCRRSIPARRPARSVAPVDPARA